MLNWWIGGSKVGTNGRWYWHKPAGNEPINNDYWRIGEPNGANREECINISHVDSPIYGVANDFKWNDYRCDGQLGYICEAVPDQIIG